MNILQNERVCRDIYQNRKSTEQDWDGGNKIKHHFHITTIHTCECRFFVFCLYSSYIYLCRVVMWKWYSILLPNIIISSI